MSFFGKKPVQPSRRNYEELIRAEHLAAALQRREQGFDDNHLSQRYDFPSTSSFNVSNQGSTVGAKFKTTEPLDHSSFDSTDPESSTMSGQGSSRNKSYSEQQGRSQSSSRSNSTPGSNRNRSNKRPNTAPQNQTSGYATGSNHGFTFTNPNETRPMQLDESTQGAVGGNPRPAADTLPMSSGLDPNSQGDRILQEDINQALRNSVFGTPDSTPGNNVTTPPMPDAIPHEILETREALTRSLRDGEAALQRIEDQLNEAYRTRITVTSGPPRSTAPANNLGSNQNNAQGQRGNPNRQRTTQQQTPANNNLGRNTTPHVTINPQTTQRGQSGRSNVGRPTGNNNPRGNGNQGGGRQPGGDQPRFSTSTIDMNDPPITSTRIQQQHAPGSNPLNRKDPKAPKFSGTTSFEDYLRTFETFVVIQGLTRNEDMNRILWAAITPDIQSDIIESISVPLTPDMPFDEFSGRIAYALQPPYDEDDAILKLKSIVQLVGEDTLKYIKRRTKETKLLWPRLMEDHKKFCKSLISGIFDNNLRSKMYDKLVASPRYTPKDLERDVSAYESFKIQDVTNADYIRRVNKLPSTSTYAPRPQLASTNQQPQTVTRRIGQTQWAAGQRANDATPATIPAANVENKDANMICHVCKGVGHRATVCPTKRAAALERGDFENDEVELEQENPQVHDPTQSLDHQDWVSQDEQL